MSPADASSAADGPTTEYVGLRAEIERRSGEQHTLVTTQLAFAGAILGFILAEPQRNLLALVLPGVSYALSARFMANELSIRRIARYIREELETRVPGGLRWESWGRDNPAEHPVMLWLFPLAFTFPGSSLVALIISFVPILQRLASPVGWLLASLWIIGASMTMTSAYFMVVSQKHWAHRVD